MPDYSKAHSDPMMFVLEAVCEQVGEWGEEHTATVLRGLVAEGNLADAMVLAVGIEMAKAKKEVDGKCSTKLQIVAELSRREVWGLLARMAIDGRIQTAYRNPPPMQS